MFLPYSSLEKRECQENPSSKYLRVVRGQVYCVPRMAAFGASGLPRYSQIDLAAQRLALQPSSSGLNISCVLSADRTKAKFLLLAFKARDPIYPPNSLLLPYYHTPRSLGILPPACPSPWLCTQIIFFFLKKCLPLTPTSLEVQP